MLPIPLNILSYESKIRKLLENKIPLEKNTVLIGAKNGPYLFDFKKYGHFLIVGLPTSRKHFLIETIIQSYLLTHSPENLRLILTDFQADLSEYSNNSLLLTDIITEPKTAVSALHWLTAEMEFRYKKFRSANIRYIHQYNAVLKDKIPSIICILKSFDHIMQSDPKEIENLVGKLISLGHEAGIHLVLSVDKLSKKNVPTDIRSNIPARAVFQTADKTDSRLADVKEAHKLDSTHFILRLSAQEQTKLKLCDIAIQDVKNIREYIEKHSNSKSSSAGNLTSTTRFIELGKLDSLIYKAAKIIKDYKYASASLIQRNLAIGYARAARILDQLEAVGLVSSAEGSKPREVLLGKNKKKKTIN